jgi:hypothetical protein
MNHENIRWPGPVIADDGRYDAVRGIAVEHEQTGTCGGRLSDISTVLLLAEGGSYARTHAGRIATLARFLVFMVGHRLTPNATLAVKNQIYLKHHRRSPAVIWAGLVILDCPDWPER